MPWACRSGHDRKETQKSKRVPFSDVPASASSTTAGDVRRSRSLAGSGCDQSEAPKSGDMMKGP